MLNLLNRSRKLLKQLSAWLWPVSGKRRKQHIASKLDQKELTEDAVWPICQQYPRALVWVSLSFLAKGNPEVHAMICIPVKEDLLEFSKDSRFCGPQEPKHSDRFKHKVLKQKQHRKRRGNKKATTGSAPAPLDGAAAEHEDLILGLWPDPLPDIPSHCSRALLGFVTQGDFSLAFGCSEAVGFVSLTGLLQMLLDQPADQRGLVLLRNPASLQYRFARLTMEV